MSLKERRYSVLVVSSAEKFNFALLSMLPGLYCEPVKFAKSVSSAKRALCERDFDFVIINSPLSDATGIRFSIDSSISKSTVVLILVDRSALSDISDETVENGVFILPKPTSKPMLQTAVGWMISARERLRGFEKKTVSIEERMEEIRTVNRAKWLLISELKYDEPHAHRYIEKQSMDRCVPKKDIAKEIIRMYS